MVHRFDIGKILMSAVGYKGIPFPGVLFGMAKTGRIAESDYDAPDETATFKEFTDKGTRLYKKDHLGRWYFMPVTFKTESGEIEFPTALISITGKKTIVETHMVGRKGSVKELINVDDYKVSLAGFIQSEDRTYPEDQITAIKELYAVNKAVELISALTDLIFDEDDKVVITDISFPPTAGLEDGQVVKIECVTDKPFELIIE